MLPWLALVLAWPLWPVCLEQARAQSASQIVPQSFAPPVQGSLGGGIEVGAAPGLDAPVGAEKLFVRLRGVQVENGLGELAAAQAAVTSRLSGRRVSGAEIFAAARELEAAYARAGYVLVRVTLPKQRLVDGANLNLVVVDGYLERVETRALPDNIRARIAAVLSPLVGVHGLRIEVLERRILLAGDTPGVILRSTLAPGSVIGASVLVIEANDQPVNGIVSADNTLSKALGRWQLGVGADVNSVFGAGEQIYLRATGSPAAGGANFFADNPRERVLAAGIVVPLGIDGLSFNLEGTLARTTPLSDGGLPPATDTFDRLSARLRYAFVRSRDFNLSSQLAFDVQDERESLLLDPGSLALFLDRVRVLRLINEADVLTPWGGTLTATLTPSFGLPVLGARTAADATPILPLSVAGADASFTKLEGTLAYAQGFAEHLAGNVSLHGQTSFGSPLVRGEQIGIAGPGALSSFDLGTLQGDSGVVGRAEVSAPFVLPQLLPIANAAVVASPTCSAPWVRWCSPNRPRSSPAIFELRAMAWACASMVAPLARSQTAR